MTTTSTSHPLVPVLGSPFLGNVVEICIVTADLKSTLHGLVQLGIGPFKIFHFTPQTVSSQHPGPFSIDVAFAEQENGMVWEVMQPVAGETLMKDFLEQTGGRGGIQHVAFDCGRGGGGLVGEKAREARRRRGEFESRGFPLAQSGVWHGKKGTCEFMFFDTMGAVGTCFESYVFSEDWEEPEDVEVYPPPEQEK
ncbi:hypothetical protein PRZ48_008521 [Zasmidium cellare]|uniref:VOC domain-containing protein n=1 Tax=Zasmidium cellare TaxID=395010 RepID=A0ABR0EFR1_ZASCE|nr:hypothetical protein PRZ48_008521 [Zasmidium cellare]